MCRTVASAEKRPFPRGELDGKRTKRQPQKSREGGSAARIVPMIVLRHSKNSGYRLSLRSTAPVMSSIIRSAFSLTSAA